MLGTNDLNITETVRMHPIDSDSRSIGSKFRSGSVGLAVRHDSGEGEGSFTLNADDFARASQESRSQHHHLIPVQCISCTRLFSLKSWEKAAKITRERYDPEIDGRILIGKVECTSENELCKRNNIQAYPTFRIFPNGSDVRDTDSLVKMMEALVASLPSSDKPRKTVLAQLTGGCRVEGFVRLKKVPCSLIISVHLGSLSFDMSHVNMSHVISHLTFGQKISQQMLSDAKRLMPYIGGSHDRLSGHTFVNRHDVGANVTIEHYLQVVKREVVTIRVHCSQQLGENLLHSRGEIPLRGSYARSSESFLWWLEYWTLLFAAYTTDSGGNQAEAFSLVGENEECVE
ncbi:hypothetical protein MLD38_012721 [Melastoma candidum]|uniref:Uncharacterized protein n=1 Tax=Melastoma candidum TaxID=119954 RepID=A0ACB9RAC3_9MYRT|nr:hypothetical protein MLD38_012721 [Melastoma candidum]